MSSYLHNTPARPRAVATSFSISNLLFWGVLPVLLLMSSEVWGQATGDYRSRQSGNWSDGSTWERYNGSAWVIANTSSFPLVAGTNSSAQSSAVSTHNVALPSGIESGDLLLIFWTDEDNNTALTLPAGWIELYNNVVGNRRRSAYYRIADGTEGASATFTTDANERSAHNSYRIGVGSFQGVPVVGVVAQGTDSNPDPPSLTSGFGNTNTLWIAASHSAGENGTVSNPGSYGNQVIGHSGNNGDNHATMVTARRELSTASTNPGVFNLNNNNRNWAANTIAIQSATVTGTPLSSSGIITIRNGHIITLNADANADQCTIETGAQVTINSGQTWTIADGIDTDLAVNGTIVNSGTITTTGNLVFNSSSTYQHAQNSGTVPVATWNETSNCTITGITNTFPGGMGQTFGNLTFNNTLGAAVNIHANLTCAGNLTLSNTNNTDFRLIDNGTDRIISVAGDFTQTSGDFFLVSGGGDGTLNVGGDFILSGGNFILKEAAGAANLNISGNFFQTGGFFDQRRANNAVTSTVTVDGDFLLTSGTYDITGTNSVGELNVGGDFSHTGGTLTRTAGGAAGYGVITFDGSTLQTYTTGGTVTSIINYEIDNSGPGVELSGPLSINSGASVTFTDGIFTTTSTNLLTFSDGATTTGASNASFVHGPIRKVGNDAFTFPVGKGTTYRPIGISAPSMNTDAFQAEYFAAAPLSTTLGTGVAEISQKEYWDLDRVAGMSSVSVTMNFTGNSMAVMPDLTNLRVARFDESLMTPAWVSMGNVGTTGSESTSGTVTSAAVPSFSFFTLGSSVAMNALPIELAFFTATPQNKTVQLNWRTATELNNAFFHVERSVNGRDFVEIGKIAGAGTSQQPLDYAFTDQLPLNGWNYYRLRQADFDGSFSFSPVQAVLMDKTGVATRLLLFPNPASTELNLKTDLLIAPGDQLELLDHTGRLMQRFSASDALNGPMDISQLPAGSYIARLRTASGFVNAAFVKQ